MNVRRDHIKTGTQVQEYLEGKSGGLYVVGIAGHPEDPIDYFTLDAETMRGFIRPSDAIHYFADWNM